MDEDLIAYLDARFRENSEQIDARFRENSEQIGARFRENSEQIDARFRENSEQIDARFRENAQQLDARFRENSQELASFREETERRFEETDRRFEQVEESVRHTRILVEGMRGDVQLLAEGVSAFDGKLAAHRVELKEEIEEVKALLHLSYRDLNRRVG